MRKCHSFLYLDVIGRNVAQMTICLADKMLLAEAIAGEAGVPFFFFQHHS